MKFLIHIVIFYLFIGVFSGVAFSEMPLTIKGNQTAADASRSSFLVNDQQAENVVNSYLNALTAGDVRTIENLLSPELLRKRQRLLRNPSYPDFLRKWYANAHFEIFGFQMLGNNRIMAEVTVLQTGGESTRLGMILIKTKAERGQPETFLIQSDIPICSSSNEIFFSDFILSHY